MNQINFWLIAGIQEIMNTTILCILNRYARGKFIVQHHQLLIHLPYLLVYGFYLYAIIVSKHN